jgi:putative NADH-flavin reductase
MQITVFGANGKVGSKVVEGLLKNGHVVVAVVYKNNGMKPHPNLKIQEGDVHLADSVAHALEGSTVVVSALGSWGTKTKDILTAGMTNIVPAMQEQGIHRIVSLTGADARDESDKPSPARSVFHAFLRCTAPRILRDGEQHIAILRASGLDWTVVRSPVMKEQGKRGYVLREAPLKPWDSIVRDDVAAAMVRLVEVGGFSQQSPFIKRVG